MLGVSDRLAPSVIIPSSPQPPLKILALGLAKYKYISYFYVLLKNEIYAAKILSLDNATDRHRELVKREIDILKPLNHLNIVQYKYHVVVDKTACLVMEYCSGGTLYQHIRDLKRDSKVMGEKEFLLTLTQISKGVEVSHASLKWSKLSKIVHVSETRVQ